MTYSTLHPQTKALLSSFSHEALVLRPDLTVISANAAFERRLGLASAQICGSALADLIVAPELAACALKVLGSGIGIHEVTIWLRPVGHALATTVLATVTPLVDETPHGFNGLLVTLEDLHPVEQSQYQMRLLATRYRDLVDRLDAFVWEADPTTFGRTYISERAEDVLGYPTTQWLNEPHFWTSVLHPDDREQTVARCVALVAEGQDFSCDYRAVAADGNVIWLRDATHLLRDTTNTVYLMRGITTDVSAQKRSEEHVRKLNRMHAVSTEINQIIARDRDLTRLFPAVCRIAVEHGGFRMAWVGTLDETTKSISVVGHAGVAGDYLEKIGKVIEQGAAGTSPLGLCLKQCEFVVVNDVRHEPTMGPWRADARRHDFHSVALFPVKVGGVVRAITCLYSAETNFFDAAEIKLLGELAQDLAFAMELSEQDAQRLESEQRLFHNEKFLSQAQSLARVGAWTVDRDSRVLSWSEETLRVFGLEPGTQFTFERFLHAIHPEDRALVAAAWAAAQNGSTYRIEYRVLRGEVTSWVEARAELTFDDNGNFLSAHGVTQDITERKAAAEAHARLLSIVESTPDFVGVANMDFQLLYLNGGARNILGLHDGEDIAEFDIIAAYPAWARRVVLEQGVPTAVAEGSWSGEVALLNRAGHEMPVSQLILAHRAADGTVEYLSTIARDLTMAHDLQQQKNLVEQVQAAHAEADAANRAKSEFLAAMSHEIRTPMNGIIGMLDVLTQSSLHAHQSEIVDIVRESSNTLLGIIEDVLDFSKIEAGKLTIEQMPLTIEEVVETVCLLFDQAAEKKSVELTLFVDPDIPRELHGDALRLRQILSNLVNNAIKFSSGLERTGRVTVRAQLVQIDPRQTWVEFCVSDNGIGIDAATQVQLFRPFEQADTSTTRRFGGTGLGLVIARRLAHLMEGEIGLKSAPNRGSTFTVRLPFEATDACALQGSEIHNIPCLIIGELAGLSQDVGAYLASAGARVKRIATIAAARHQPAPPDNVWVWVFDAATRFPPIDELRAAAQCYSELNIRIVVVARGKRRTLRRDADDIVQIDGNLLTRARILEAVMVAAGRLEQQHELHARGLADASFEPPDRDTAQRKGQLILVAEDNHINQQVIVRQLALLGLAADVVDDGRAALARWRSGDYALLLTDLHMPLMDGYSLTAAIRAAEAQSSAAPAIIIALTANAIAGEADHCRAAGINDYLSKPVRLAALQGALEQWLVPAEPLEPVLQLPESACRAAPVEVAELRALIGDDAALIAEFLAAFRISAADIAVELESAFAAQNLDATGAAAHKLKSSARSVGALTLCGLCEQIERFAKDRDSVALAALIPHFGLQMREVDAYLAAWPLTARATARPRKGQAA